MPAAIKAVRASILVCALSFAGLGPASAADSYDAAVSHSGRSATDSKRDSLDHPARFFPRHQ